MLTITLTRRNEIVNPMNTISFQKNIQELIQQVSLERIKNDVFYLAKNPLPYRKANYTLPGHHESTLAETDEFIHKRLKNLGYHVENETCQVQAFRCNQEKPLHHWYDSPFPDDPWFQVDNLYAVKKGNNVPAESIVIVSHKDSPSWYNSPGAYDNAVGVAANLEIARIMAPILTMRKVIHLFCNEEHTPWTSVIAAQGARQRGENHIAVFNLDAIGGKSQQAIDLNQHTNVSRYSTPEGAVLADLVAQVTRLYTIPLHQKGYSWDRINDDDGSFINAGFPSAILNIGSFPYEDPNYHMEGDTPENVDFENVTLTTQASLAAIAHLALLC